MANASRQSRCSAICQSWIRESGYAGVPSAAGTILTFRAEGYTNWQNGSFHYCPASGDARYGKVLIVNIQGRTALSVDADGDGIDEQANGSR